MKKVDVQDVARVQESALMEERSDNVYNAEEAQCASTEDNGSSAKTAMEADYVTGTESQRVAVNYAEGRDYAHMGGKRVAVKSVVGSGIASMGSDGKDALFASSLKSCLDLVLLDQIWQARNHHPHRLREK